MPPSPEAKESMSAGVAATGVAMTAIPVIVAAAWLFPRQRHINWKWARFTLLCTA